MKNFLLPLALSALLLSCQEELNEQSLIGTWRVKEYQAEVDISPNILLSAKKIAETYVYTFNTGGSFFQTDNFSPEGRSGQWKITSDQKAIELNYENSKTPSHYDVESFSSTEMTWIHSMGDLGSEKMILQKD